MASQRNKKTESSQSKPASAAGHGHRASRSDSRRPGHSATDSRRKTSDAHDRGGHAHARSGSAKHGSNGNSRGRNSEFSGMLGRVAGGAKDARSKAVDSVKQHPVSAAMIGAGVAGLGLLAAKLVRDWSQSEEQHDIESEPGEPLEDRAEESAGESDEGPAAEEGQEPQTLMDRARGAWDAVRDSASNVGQSVEQGYEHGKEKLATVWEDHPLAISAGLLAAGMAAGMLIPATGLEKKIFGPAAGRITNKLKNAGRDLIDQGSELASRVVSEAGDAIREEAEREGLTPDKLARKAKRIAGRIKDAISE